MSTQGMIQTMRFNSLQKSERIRLYDRKVDGVKGVYGPTEDHTKMKSHVFAAFQKEQFRKRRKEKVRHRRALLITTFIMIGLVILFLLIWNDIDFGILKSPQFQ